MRSDARRRPVGTRLGAMRRTALAAAGALVLACAGSAQAETLAFDDGADIILLDTASGLKTPLVDAALQESSPDFSPDGARIASVRSGELLVMSADGSGRIAVPNVGGSSSAPAWRPDGSEIAFISGAGEYRAVKPDGTGRRLIFDPDPGAVGGADRIGSVVGSAISWSPDGTRLAVGISPSGFQSDFEIWTVGPNGESPVKLTAGHVQSPAFSPDGSRIAFHDIIANGLAVMNADGSGRAPVPTGAVVSARQPKWTLDGSGIVFLGAQGGQTDLFSVPVAGGPVVQLTNDAQAERNPDVGPGETPVIFVHGFLGSKIFCGAEELWANLPLPKLDRMELRRDGTSNAGCPSAGPQEGQILETALGSDVYQSTVDFLRDRFPGRFHLYAWDWRKSPDEALAGLDALVERVRTTAPGRKVVLMAHSMGGLVTRLYVNDQARAAKVARVLTIGTPYWGSPKALFPFLYGVESPGVSGLDAVFDNAKLRSFARFLQGMFFLWPSARYGGWLSIDDRSSPLSQTALLDLVEEFGGNRSLLATALGAHAQRIDDFGSGGTDYQVVIGSGVHTIGAIDIAPPPLAGLGIVPDRDIVSVDWVNGDGTVPLRSAIGSTPDVRRHFTCGVSHVPLPGHPAVTVRAEPFLDRGEEFANPGTPTQRLCDPQGFALSIYPLEGTVFASSIRARARVSQGSGTLTLDQAEQRGAIEAFVGGANIEAATSTLQPLTLSLPTSRGALLRVAPMTNGKRGRAKLFLARGKGTVTIELAGTAVVKRGAATIRASKDDTRRPRTGVRIKRRGTRFLLLFKVTDDSPTTTFAALGKIGRRVRGGRLLVTAKQLRRGIRYQSVDALGNTEKPKRLRRP